MIVTGQQLIDIAQTQAGKPYRFGAESVDLAARAWDCSELVEAVCRAAGVDPTVPDGAWAQWRHTTRCSVAQAVASAGALLFVGDGTGIARSAITHVAFSRGDGTTIEARGTRWGTGNWPTGTRFGWGGLIPGVDYSTGARPSTIAPAEPVGHPIRHQEDRMELVRNNIPNHPAFGQVWEIRGKDRVPVDNPEQYARLAYYAGLTGGSNVQVTNADLWADLMSRHADIGANLTALSAVADLTAERVAVRLGR